MRHHARWAIVFLVVVVTMVGGCGWLTTSPLGSFLGLVPSNLDLMAIAEQMVAPEYANARLIEVLGAPSSGSAQVASDVDRWQFRFTEDPDGPDAGTVWVDYENGQFTGPFYTSQGLIGTVIDPLPRDMTLAQALELARAAGYSDAFASVAFRKPLTFPPVDEALYALNMPGRYVLVGAETGTVAEESNRDEPTFLEQ